MADRYRMLDGNWNLANSWSASSGGPGGASVPTSADNVYFDTNTPTGTHTLNVAANCLNLDFTGFNGIFSTNVSVQFGIYGNITFSSGMTYVNSSSSDANFRIYGSCLLITNTKPIVNRFVIENGGTLVFGDDITWNYDNGNRSDYIVVSASGTMNPNGKTVTWTKTLFRVTGNLVFYNLIYDINNSSSEFSVNGNLTVQNLLTVKGRANANRTIIQNGDWNSGQSIFNLNDAIFEFCDFYRIKGEGAFDWDISETTGGAGDCTGNSGITFTAPINCYWVHPAAASSPISTVANWRTTSGGDNQARVPLPQDKMIFDVNSFTATGRTVQDGSMRRLPGFTWAGVTNNPTWTTGNFDVVISGDIIFSSDMTVSFGRNAIAAGVGNCVIDSGGHSQLGTGVTIRCYSGNYSLTRDLVFAIGKALVFRSGNLDTCGYNFTGGVAINAESLPVSFTARDSIITVIGNYAFNSGSTSFTFNIGTSTVIMNSTFVSNTENNYTNLFPFYNLIMAHNDYNFSFRGSISVANEFTVLPGRSIATYNNGTRINAPKFILTGTKDNPIKIGNTAANRKGCGLTKTDGGTVLAEYVIVEDSQALPVNTFFAKKSQKVGTAENWTFITGWQHKINGVTPEKVNGTSFSDMNKVNGLEI